MAAANTFLTPTASAQAGSYPPRDYMQKLIDRAANFNLFVGPGRGSSFSVLRTAGEAIGIHAVADVHRFDILVDTPDLTGGMRASNTVGPPIGSFEFKLLAVPYDFVADPNRMPPPTPIDPAITQRLVLADAVIKLGQHDGFRGFGTGRTFPLMVDGKPQLSAGFIGMASDGFGKFQGCDGNFTFCGELRRDEGLVGHIMVRIMDPTGKLRTDDELPLGGQRADSPDPTSSYLSFITQKRRDGEQENFISFDPTGQVRGLNIPVDAQKVLVEFSTQGGFQCRNLRTGGVFGLEIGFGREPFPRTERDGVPRQPFRFEGVSRYRFYDTAGRTVGYFTSNVLEGRSVKVAIPEQPDLPGLRFGFVGPFIDGSGCFAGAQGFLYGASGSVFAPPPFPHVISNWYGVRIIDPQKRFRMPYEEK